MLYPQRSGKITIPSGKLDIVLRVPGPARQRSSVFDDFFGSSSYIDVKKELTTPPVTIDVKPLPSGKPASFSGAVGNFTMPSSISSNNVKTDDAVTVKVKISGNGNIKLVKNPEVAFPNDFDVYDPKVEVDIKPTAAGTSGTKTIEYMAIPRYAGDFEIPAIAFSYFDTKTGSYMTITSDPYKHHVEQGKGGGTSSPVVSNFSNKESVKYLGKDIRYLKVNGIHFVPNNELFFGSFMYYMCYLIPAILFIVFFFIYRKQVKENSNLALVRTKKANKMAVRRLKNAGKLMKENKWEVGEDDEELFEYAMHPAQYEAYKSGKAKEDFLADVAKRRAEKDKSPEEDAKPKTLTVQVDGQAYRVTVAYGDAELLAAPVAAAPAGEGKDVLSPLEGKFFLIKNASDTPVKVGDVVKEGDVLCYVEAMKTYNAVRAEFGGTITAICLSSGDAVSEDDVLMTIQ